MRCEYLVFIQRLKIWICAPLIKTDKVHEEPINVRHELCVNSGVRVKTMFREMQLPKMLCRKIINVSKTT